MIARAVLALVLALPSLAAAATEPPAAAEIEALIATLEDPQARARLVERLRALAQAEAAPQATAAEGAGARAMQAVSARLERVTAGVTAVAGGFARLPEFGDWLKVQARDPERRALWLEILRNLLFVVAATWLLAWLARAALDRARQRLAGHARAGAFTRVFYLTGGLLLDLVPVAVLAGVAYAMLGVLELRAGTRLVALAWVHAGVVVWAAAALSRFLFAPAAPVLRLLPLDDESAAYADIWARRLVWIGAYGYFALQAAVLLGLPAPVYATLLRLLGAFLTALGVVLVLQNREGVAGWIRALGAGDAMASERLRTVRDRFAAAWHVVAIAYLLLLYAVWAFEVPGGFMYVVQGTVLTLAVLVLARLALHGLDTGFRRGFHIPEDLQARFPGLEARANRYLAGLRAVLTWGVYLLAALALLDAWGLGTFAWLATDTGRTVAGKLIVVLAILAVAIVAWEITNGMIQARLAREGDAGSARTRTLLDVARNALLVAITVVSVLMVLGELGVNIAPLLAGAGVVGLAVGFGAQTLVKDVITGVFILLENLFEVGDVIQVGDKAGLVESVTIRRVRLRDLSGTVHTIPFSAIATVSNLTREFSFYVFDVGVAYREDLDEVIRVLTELGAELQADPEYGPLILEPLEILGVDRFADSAVIVKARLKTLPIKQWMVGREFNRRMKRRFDELGIEIPFPHRTLYFGEDKQGRAPPAHLRIEDAAAGG